MGNLRAPRVSRWRVILSRPLLLSGDKPLSLRPLDWLFPFFFGFISCSSFDPLIWFYFFP
jgi:hypothetical protein